MRVQVDFPPNMCSMDIGGRKLDILQYHFHSPSEHAFEGVHAAMEAHLVHRKRPPVEVLWMTDADACAYPSVRHLGMGFR